MRPPVAYVSTEPEVVAAVRQQRADEAAFLARLSIAVSGLGWSTGGAHISGMFGPARVTAVMAEDMAAAKVAGWKPAGGRAPDGLVAPVKGARGQTARQFLADLGSCPQIAQVIGAHGAPEYVSTGTGDGRELISAVRAQVFGDAVHIEYPVEPTDQNVSRFASDHRGAPDARWAREPLSAYYAALEAHEAALEASL